MVAAEGVRIAFHCWTTVQSVSHSCGRWQLSITGRRGKAILTTKENVLSWMGVD